MASSSAAPFAVEEASIASLHEAILSRRTTCVAIVEAYLARIAAYDHKGPALAAILALNPRAREMAAQLDAHFARTGELIGPLHGVPVAVKDNYNTTDMPTSGGNVLFKDVIPPVESAVTKRLREAGAIILAKTNMHELALSGITISSLGGQTKNPYDLTRTPGGSSGGTGAAIAANFAAIGLATDTVNSIRSPASANNLVGFRSTKGLVSRAGVIPVSHTQDVVGAITRSVEDAAIMLDVMAGFDPDDPATARALGHIPHSFTDYLDADGLNGARIGVFTGFLGKNAVHAEVNAIVAAALNAFRDAGATIVEIADPMIDSDTILRDDDVQKWEFKTLFNDYLVSLGDRAPVKTLRELIASGQYHRPSLEKFLNETDALESPETEHEYLIRLARIERLRERVLLLMAEHRVEAVAYPLQKRLVYGIGEPYQGDRTGILAGVTGFPAVTVPAGFSPPSADAPIGVPVGLDILARPFDDARLIRIAYAFEQATKWRRPPPSTPPLAP
jgi:Asp-tRNA(Asn)/Glu-tRNA(Gln) amidotransferase A subunit family amidase